VPEEDERRRQTMRKRNRHEDDRIDENNIARRHDQDMIAIHKIMGPRP
jgi:hypothetical protein